MLSSVYQGFIQIQHQNLLFHEIECKITIQIRKGKLLWQSDFDVYLSEPVTTHHSKFNVLDYWKIDSDTFPNLSRMARDYLAVPGTFTPSERAFSGGRQLITDFCCSLKGQWIYQL